MVHYSGNSKIQNISDRRYNGKNLLQDLILSFFFIRYHPHFKNVMQSRISQLMGIDYKFDLMLSEDGSGRGAALVAAVLKRGEEEEGKALGQ